MKVTSALYGQFLINTPANVTGTYFADSLDGLNHNSVYRFLKNSRLTSSLVWEKALGSIVLSKKGYLIFDDTVADKDFSREIELVRHQYSGNAHDVIRGIGVVTAVYYNPEIKRFWVVDHRIFAPDQDGKSKLDHVRDMLLKAVERNLAFSTVLMDSWYATTEMMLFVDLTLRKTYYCPLKSNRKVDDSGGANPYRQVGQLAWDEAELERGKLVKVQKFPKDYKHKLFRVPVSTNRTDFVVTNDLSQEVVDDVRKECAIRWHIEEFHRELKQATGLEGCECRIARSQRNHITMAILAWWLSQGIGLQRRQDHLPAEERAPTGIHGFSVEESGHRLLRVRTGVRKS